MKSVVWFKKDLRTSDHEPLFLGSQSQEVIALYIVEPEWLKSFEFDPSHWQFLKQSLVQLNKNLSQWNISLVVRLGEATEVLRELHSEWSFDKLHSHQETGVDWTFKRDLRVQSLCKDLGVSWTESLQFGVFRKKLNRDSWAQKKTIWLKTEKSFTPKHQSTSISLKAESLLDIEEKMRIPPTKKILQTGGEVEARNTLCTFLQSRGETYLSDISKPFLSQFSSSRMSAYLSFGNISIRELHQAAQSTKNTHIETAWRKSLWAFENRLWWHCHFIQKMESEPQIEFQNMNRSFDQLREPEFNESYFKAWCEGQTGFPMVDATMRCLLQTGWVNFRMRAMLVSFAAYHLWLHWEKPAQFLAKHFLDFEPGIHFSQFQMQSGVTGINAIRIYSPEKQAEENDPTGAFIKQYCPELEPIPDEYLSQPHLTPPLLQMAINCRIGVDYPEPIVDSASAYKSARERIYKWKGLPEVRKSSQKVFIKHGSRQGRHFPKQKRQL